MGIFTPHEYTWVSPRRGLVQIGAFIATFLSVCYVVKATYPDRPSFPREFEDGLERELGGAGATRVSEPSRQRIDTVAARQASRLTSEATGEKTRGSGAVPGGGVGLGWPCTCRYRPTNWTGLDSRIMSVVSALCCINMFGFYARWSEMTSGARTRASTDDGGLCERRAIYLGDHRHCPDDLAF